MRSQVSRCAIPLLVMALLLVMGCDKLKSIGTSVAGTIYMEGAPIGGHLTLYDFETGAAANRDETTDGHFIIADVKAGEYVLRFMDMRAQPIGGGMYIKVQPGRPVTDLKFEVWDVVPPPKNRDGTERIPYDEFKKKFGLRDKADRDAQT